VDASSKQAPSADVFTRIGEIWTELFQGLSVSGGQKITFWQTIILAGHLFTLRFQFVAAHTLAQKRYNVKRAPYVIVHSDDGKARLLFVAANSHLALQQASLGAEISADGTVTVILPFGQSEWQLCRFCCASCSISFGLCM
jgi:hypothetical protein